MTDLRADMNDRFARVDGGFTKIGGKLDAAAAGQRRIVDFIEGLAGGRDNGPAQR